MVQELLLADDLMPSLKSGDKICTIRKGKREFNLGELFFKAVNNPSDVVAVNVNEVVHKTLGELTDQEAQMDGAETAAEMAEAMKRFYPDITPQTPITIVKYNLA